MLSHWKSVVNSVVKTSFIKRRLFFKYGQMEDEVKGEGGTNWSSGEAYDLCS